MLNGRIGGGVTEWHSYQSMVWAHSRRALLFSINAWAHSRRALLFSINAWAHSPRTANHPKIVTIRALYRDPMPLRGHTIHEVYGEVTIGRSTYGVGVGCYAPESTV